MPNLSLFKNVSFSTLIEHEYVHVFTVNSMYMYIEFGAKCEN